MIRIERLYKSFDVPALRGVALEIARGTIVGVMGPPGSGKSLLLRAIAGLVEPDAGSILIGGREMVGSGYLERIELQARLGMAFQNLALFDHLDVSENVAFPLRRRGEDRPGVLAEQVSKALSTVGLAGFEARKIQGLSGGQKRRVGLARAAIHRPEYLLYDEPAAGLDPVTTSRIFQLLRRQQEETGATIVVVSSDVERLLESVDAVIMMVKGRVVFDGTVAEAWTTPEPNVRAFLQSAAMPDRGPERLVVATPGAPDTSRSTALGAQLLAARAIMPPSSPKPPSTGPLEETLASPDGAPKRTASKAPLVAATPSLDTFRRKISPSSPFTATGTLAPPPPSEPSNPISSSPASAPSLSVAPLTDLPPSFGPTTERSPDEAPLPPTLAPPGRKR